MDNPIFASEEHLAFARGRNMVDDDVKRDGTNGYMIRGKHYDAMNNSRLNGGKHHDVISNAEVIGESKRDVKNNNHSLTNGKHIDIVKEDEESTENLCGAFGKYPKWLQCCAKPRSFLATYCILNILAGAEVAFFMGSTTSLEKHFHFSSKDIGYMILFSELGPIILALVLSYLGGRGNRPRWLALGEFLIALGTFIAFSAVLFYPPPTLSESGDLKDSRKFCAPEEAQAYRPLAPPPSSSSNSSARLATFSRLEVEEASCFLSNTFAFTLFFVGRTLKGVGGALHFTLGSSYMDDSIKKKDSPIYFAMSTTLGIVGPLLGFSLSAVALGIYVIPGQNHGILPSDPRWVGAWWIGPLLFSILTFFFSLVVSLFPRKMKKKVEGNQDIENLPKGETRQISEIISDPSLVHTSVVPCENLEQSKTKERNGGIKGVNGTEERLGNGSHTNSLKTKKERRKIDDLEEEGDTKTSFEKMMIAVQELRVALRRVLSNKVVIFLAGADFFILMGAIGMFFWLPKYFEHQFRTSKADSAFYTGISGISPVILGIVVGGVWIHRFRPRARTVAISVTASLSLYLLALLGLMTISCDFNDDLPGILSPDEKSVELYRGCSGGCRCSQKEFVPVCIRDGPMSLTYFSPCHAGCPDAQFQDTFHNCTCGSPSAKVTLGYCRETCSSFLLYNVFTIVIKFFLSIGSFGTILISMRCVAEEDKPISLGMKSTVGALATMLNPVVFGSLVDSACLVWEEQCGERGSCWVYNSQDFRYKLHGITCALFAVGIFFMVQVVRHIGDLALAEDTPAGDASGTTSGGPLSLFSELSDPKEATEERAIDVRGEKARRSFMKLSNKISGKGSKGKEDDTVSAPPSEPPAPARRTDEGVRGKGRRKGSDENRTASRDEYRTSQREEYRTSPRDDYRTSPRDEYHTSPSDDYRTPPRDEYRTSPHNEYRTSPSDDYRTPPRDEYRTSPRDEYRTPPHDKYRTSPHDEYQAAPGYQAPSLDHYIEHIEQEIPRNDEIRRDIPRARHYPHILPSDVVKTTGV